MPRQLRADRRHEWSHDRERCPLIGGGNTDGAATVQLVTDRIQDDHFAVEGVERAEPEVAVPQQLPDGQLAVVHTVEQRAHQAGLKYRVTPAGLPAVDHRDAPSSWTHPQ